MRIVQVTQSYPPSQGGVENHVEAISNRLVDAGHKVIVISADAGTGERSEIQTGVTIRRFRSLSPSGAYHFAPQVVGAIRKYKPDVVHAHNYHALLLPFAAIAATNTTLVVTPHYHGGSDSKFRDRLLKLYHPIGQWALNQADAVVAVSDWERKQLKNDFDIQAEVLPNGINVERFFNVQPYQHENPYVLCVGRLEKYKGVQHVIKSMADLPEYDLLVAGSGPYREQLKSTARQAGVAGRVNFLGYVSDDRLPSLYRGAEVFVTLSSFESFGLTVGEALAAGTPCLVLRRGALVDWESYDGVIGVSTRESENVAKGIIKAQSQSVQPQSVPRWDDHVNRLEQIYSQNSFSDNQYN